MKKLLPIILLISIGLCANAHSAYHAQRTDPVAVGEVAPDFTLEDQSGQKLTLSERSREESGGACVLSRLRHHSLVNPLTRTGRTRPPSRGYLHSGLNRGDN